MTVLEVLKSEKFKDVVFHIRHKHAEFADMELARIEKDFEDHDKYWFDLEQRDIILAAIRECERRIEEL